MHVKFHAFVFSFLALTSCTGQEEPTPAGGGSTSTAEPARAPEEKKPAQDTTVSFDLAPASGSSVSGHVSAMPMGDGVHFTGEVKGLEKGSTHGMHIHEKGDCSAPDATSAGGHFNPTGSEHGRMSAPVHHAGDMDNLVADDNGVAKVNVHVSGVSLGDGGPNDVAGKALVVHADPDDYTTQPSGNSGARVACGVIGGAK